MAGEAPMPPVRPGEVLVQMTAAAICGSDLHIVFGGFHPSHLPGQWGYPGHEGIGFAVESQSASFERGDLVLTVPEARRARCFAEFQVLPERSLLRLPADSNPQRLLMAQQLGTAIFGLRGFSADRTGRTAALIGAGPVGLFFCQLLRLSGFELVLVGERNAERRRVALELGADAALDTAGGAFTEGVADLTHGAGVDLAIEAAGYDETRALAVAAAARGGTVGLFGYPEIPGYAPFPFAEAFAKGLTLKMTRNAQLERGLRSFREAIELIQSERVRVDELISTPFPLECVFDAFEASRDQKALKVIIGFAT